MKKHFIPLMAPQKKVEMKKTIIFFIMVVITLTSFAQEKEILNNKINETLDRASYQYTYLMNELPEGRYPKTFDAKNNKFETSNSGWWCSGFYPGSMLYLDEALNNAVFQQEIDRVLKDLKKEQYNTTTHDLGFMMFCSFGNANRLDPKPEYNEILMNSAKSLITRFNETVGCIKSWDSANDDYLVIIDNMMNLELLFWATEYSGDRTYYDIAVTHANTTIKNHFREDNSSYHVLNYNSKNGEINKKSTAQGFSDDSAWARGQAWGLYGFTVMYRATKEQKYLDQALAVADFIVDHPNLPKDKVPYWDFNAPNIPDALRDSSAGAIIASALLELYTYESGKQAKKYYSTAETILKTLTSDEYIAEEGANGGFLLKHGVGHLPGNSEVDVPLSYGDYYLIEAMLRYKKLFK